MHQGEKLNESIRRSIALLDLLVIFLCIISAGISLNFFRLDISRTLSRQNETPVGIITFKYKAAQRRFIDRVLWDRLRTESPVYNGDTIRTAELSEATLTFAGGETIDIAENTLIHILVTKTETAVSLDSGTLNASAGAGSSMALLSGDSRVEIGSGSVVSAGAGDTGLTLRVVEGNARLSGNGPGSQDEQGGSGLIQAGEALTLGSSGTVQTPPLVTVTQPLPNARFYNSAGTGSGMNIPFTFNRVNFQGPVQLDISADRSFTRIAGEYTADGAQAAAALNSGVYFWRAYSPGSTANAASGKVTIIDAPSPSLVSPADGASFRYRSKTPSLRFQWTAAENVTSSTLEVADNPSMLNPRIRTKVRGTALLSTELGEGRWYWRVSPVFSREFEGPPSPVFSFTIEQNNALSAPVLVSPREGELINTAEGRSPVYFSWRNEEEAISYTVLISPNRDLSNPVLTNSAKESYHLYTPSALAVLGAGSYYWGVRFTDSEGNESPASTARPFTALEQEVIQRTIFPPDGYAVAVSMLPDFRFTWKTNLPWATKIEIASNADFSRLVLNETVSGESFQSRSLPEGDYWWRISSTAENGMALQSAAKRFSAVLPFPEPVIEHPAAESLLVIQEGDDTDFRWQSINGAEYYRFKLYYGSETDPVFESANMEETSLSLTLEEEGPYTWTVQAFAGETRQRSRRNGQLATNHFVMRVVKPALLEYPPQGHEYPGLEAARTPDTARWTSVERPARSRFILSRNRDLSSPLTAIADPPRTVQLPKLSQGNWYWTIEAETEEGYDITAASSWFTVLPVPPLPAAENRNPPAGFLANVDYLVRNTTIRFSWDPVPGANQYAFRIFRTETGTANPAAVFSASIKENFYVLEDLAILDNGRFSWQVEAQSADDEGFIEQNGTPMSNAFTVDIPTPNSDVRAQTGELYGIEPDDRRRRRR
jgi:hypothetical protein